MHVKKFTEKEYERVLRHCIRTKNNDGIYNPRTNSEIDFSKTDLNYCFGELADIKDLKAQIKAWSNTFPIRNTRTIVMASWVLQLPNDYEGNTYEFFKTAYEIFKEKYPYTLNGFVHMDETTPHMHFCFCPIDGEKFNAKAILTKEELNNMHDWFEKELNGRGIRCELTKAETKERKKLLAELGDDAELFEHDEKPEYLPMDELKRRTQLKIMKEYQEEKERLEEYKKYVDDYKAKNLDDIIIQKTDMIPKKEVQQMLQGLFDMLEMDLGKEKVKKYRKFVEGFGYIIDEAKEFIKHTVLKIKGE